MNKDFENWWFKQRMINNEWFPMATDLLYNVCKENNESFILVNKYLELAFKAGYESGKNEQN